jgi:ribosomal protein L11 methyltransferase
MQELCLLAAEDRVEALCDALMERLDAQSVAVEDAAADAPDEDALFGEPGLPAARAGWRRSRMKALFRDAAQATAAAAWLLAQAWAAGVQVQAIATVPDEDWVQLTQSQFAPVEITPSFWIVPSWHDPPRGARRVLRLDPGLAFGTGTHPTTRMCLRWIARKADARAARWSRVLDYGCGSGILAIAAALHGAHGIDAVDIDPAAVAATRANAERNRVELRAAAPDAARGRYALVLANILATPLKLLAPLLASHLEVDADLVLAGILERQADEMREAYATWCRLEDVDREEGWVLMSAHGMIAEP